MLLEWSAQFAARPAFAVGLGAMPAAAAGGPSGRDSASSSDFAAYALEKRDEAIGKGGEIIAAMDRRVDELSTRLRLRAGQASAETRTQWIAARRELMDLRSDARRSLEDMKHATDVSWNATRDVFASALRELGNGIDAAARKVDS